MGDFRYLFSNYVDDVKFSKFFIRKYFYNYFDDPELALADLVFALSHARKFYDDKKCKFTSYATAICFNCISRNRFCYYHHDNIIVYLDDPIADGLTFADFLADDQPDDIGVVDMIKKILKAYSKRNSNIVCLFVKGYSMTEIGIKYEMSKQNVALIIKKFRHDLTIELAKVGYKVGA